MKKNQEKKHEDIMPEDTLENAGPASENKTVHIEIPIRDEPEEAADDSCEAESKICGKDTSDKKKEDDNGQSVIDEKRGVFNRKGRKDSKHGAQQEKIDALTKTIEELKDKDLRRQAEFDNFRKRTEKEKSQRFEAGEIKVLEVILPIIDNFERGFESVEEADKEDAFVSGMSMVYKQLITELEKIGVTKIEAVGKEFDPNLHNAVMQVDTGEYESGIVASEMQKGYMLGETVLRYSMVAVQS